MKLTRFALALLLASTLAAQTLSEAKEEEELRQAMGEAGSSPLEITRALERHLRKYPKSARRDEIERTLVKTAIEARDSARILKYGEPFIARNPQDPLVLERVTRLLTQRTDKASNERALDYGKRFENMMRQYQKQAAADGGRQEAQMAEDLQRGIARGLLFQAIAQGNLGANDESLTLARRAFESLPSGETAREMGRALIRLNKFDEAVKALADAFVLPEPRFTEDDRASIRNQLGEVYRKSHPSEQGLGDAVLAAYDRSQALQAKLRVKLSESDPNTGKKAMEYTLSGVDGSKLNLASLQGKVVVLDFWATWCGPCQQQYPMYERVKENFKDRKDIVFLGINTDEERDRVKPFLAQNKWNKTVYFEDGLQKLLEVRSIPTTMIFNRKGELAARMNGFVPDRFVDMLTERIRDTLAEE